MLAERGFVKDGNVDKRHKVKPNLKFNIAGSGVSTLARIRDSTTLYPNGLQAAQDLDGWQIF